MVNQNRDPINRVDQSADARFLAFWHGQVVYQNGRVRHFKIEDEAWEFLARCDLEGRIIH